MSKTKKQKAEDREFALDYFRRFWPAGSTLCTTVVSVSRSGMARTIKLIGTVDGVPVDLSTFASWALAWPMARDGSGVRVSGAGMDMGFYLVYSLGRHVWPDFDQHADDILPYPYAQRWL